MSWLHRRVTPLEANLCDLQRTREAWLAAIHCEDRETETVCMARLNALLDQRAKFNREAAAWASSSTP